MNLIENLRAKSESEVEVEKEILLIDHTIEVLKRIKQLRDFIEKNKDHINYELIKTKEFFIALSLAAILHDLGKISYKYQKRFYGDNFEKTPLKEFLEPIKHVEVRHEILSSIWASIILDENKNDEISNWLPKIRTAILLHHYNEFYTQFEKDLMEIIRNYEKEIKDYLKFINDKKIDFKKFFEEFIRRIRNLELDFVDEALKYIDYNWVSRLQDLFEKIKEREDDISGFAEFYRIPESDESTDWYSFFVFLGALRRCDYSASGDFNIEKEINLSKEVYKNLLEKIKNCIGKENEKIWQEKILEKTTYDNLILIAPTGAGKTEFALLWAAKKGKKLIYTLPLRVALNDLFFRFRKEKEESNSYFNKNFVDILHSTSFIEYLKEEKEGKETSIGSKISAAKIFSSPLILTTPDQVFLSSLKYYGFDKLINIYPLSTIIVDEIQAYTPEMAAIVIKTLEIIRNLQGNILIITATFPPYFKEFLKEMGYIDLKKLIENKQISEKEIKNYSIKRHKIKLIDENLFQYKEKNSKFEIKLDSKGYQKLKEIIKDKAEKNILIIVNNVGKAIRLFQELEKEKEIKERIFLDDLPLLLHARIIEKEKSKRISAVKEAIKRGKKGMILVATQIVEASVDIDFDILITEISPIDSQIQRWGRIWRNRGEKDYEEKNENDEIVPNIYIFTGIDKGTVSIYYPKELLEKTIEVLKKEENTTKIFSYEEERTLVEKVFKEKINSKQTIQQFYESKISQTLEWLKFYSVEKRSEAQRIFRRIAGIQVFIPNLTDEEDEIYTALCKILEDKNNWDLPLISKEEENSIVGLVKKKIKNEKLKENKELLKWKILETLYNYSFNLPIYAFEKIKFISDVLEKNMFKGFFVLSVKDKEFLKDFKKYGISNLKDIDLDSEEIKLQENIF